MVNEKQWNLIKFIIKSDYRLDVLNFLSKKKSTPLKLSSEINLSINQISNILKGLMNRELIRCLTPQQKKGRIYEITEIGNFSLHKVKSLQESA